MAKQPRAFSSGYTTYRAQCSATQVIWLDQLEIIANYRNCGKRVREAEEQSHVRRGSSC